MHSKNLDGNDQLLVDLMVDSERQKLLKDISRNLQSITINERQLCDLELLTSGAFSPLKGFMGRSDYESVIDRMRLQNGELWPIPICLDVAEVQADQLDVGQSVVLRDPEGFLLAIMHIEDMWPIDHEKEACQVYGTCDPDHPGTRYLNQSGNGVYIGGQIEVLNLPIHSDFKQMRLTPVELRNVFAKLGWKRVVVFQTHDPIYRPQFEMTIKAMQQAKANLLLHPVVGMTKPGDFDHYTRVRCYQAVSRHYPPNSYLINLLPLAMRMAGPKEVLLHMIISKNYGCSHFIVGHDHANPDSDDNGRVFYEGEASREIAEKHGAEIGVKPLTFEEMVYLPFEDEYVAINQVNPDSQRIRISGTDIRKRVRRGKRTPAWATFPEVQAELRRAYPPPRLQGFTVFLTGLSGAGKSTIAKVLYAHFLEIGKRPVTLLDGDIVRRNLSSNLSFSKEDRDINVQRIGFVASEITKNRGIAICAPIAPYEETRREIRSTIEAYGGFIEVHVSTPLKVCERRDRKGMYAKARAGLIKGFTGVDDPYEVPQNPEVRIDTSELSPDEATQEILLFLNQQGYI